MGDDCLAVNGSSSQNESVCVGLQCSESRDQLLGSSDERAACFIGLEKSGGVMYNDGVTPRGQQASTLLELMTIRAYHSKSLRQCGLGTALGFRTRRGELTSIPAIIVFVARKVHTQWLHELQVLPSSVEGPGGLWCDVDVVEFSYFGVPTMVPKKQLSSEILDGLRGMDATIGSGTQVASQETYGTLGALVQSQTGLRQLGFITNRHVAVDLDYPCQKMFHPLPPNLGPGVYLGAVKRATSFVKDDLWYGIFAGMNPETFVRADGAFIPFSETFDISKVTTSIKGIGSMGDVYRVDLQSQISSIVGRKVVKVGRSSGVTKGVIMGYAVEYNDENGICFLTDFLIVGEKKKNFDLEGDSGSLILLSSENETEKAQPVGLIWGGTANRGRLKLRNEHGPENWTSGVDLGRLLDILQLDIITTDQNLRDAVLLQELVAAKTRIGPCNWMGAHPEKEPTPEPILSPPYEDLHQVPDEEAEEPETCSPAAKDLISYSCIGNFPLQREDTRPPLQLADEDLSMRLSGPSSSTAHQHLLNPKS
ncbi:protein NARROW LEAF 1 isoform X2 [Physcomitrium patens]|uniref:protein NARROW LEAF 1 isoform X2 n=1 Tax=Physcomitrium patens TaxID=3218 RepID=UPI003CCD44DB